MRTNKVSNKVLSPCYMKRKLPLSVVFEEGMLLVAEEKLKLEQDITSNEKDVEVQETKSTGFDDLVKV
uniref:Uncharacterized protein n=1 Tax=Glossina morsitans morsitans TaxID=37546 RepID=A0A1B0GB83_GLOMM